MPVSVGYIEGKVLQADNHLRIISEGNTQGRQIVIMLNTFKSVLISGNNLLFAKV